MDHEQDLVVMCDMWVQALAAPLRVRARHVDGMLLCHLLVSVLQVQENHSLENLLGFKCVFQLRAAAVGLLPRFRLSFGTPCSLGLAECVIGRATVRFRSLKISPSIHFYQVHEYSRSAFSHRSSNARARN